MICAQAVKKFYPSNKFKVEIAPHEAGRIATSWYLEGLAEARIKGVRSRLLSYDTVVLLGADCVLYSDIDSLLEMPGKIVLVPHVVTPPPQSAPFYRTGHANGDVICFRKESLPIIDWLLTQPMRRDPKNGMFFEQSLLSSLPFFFDDVTICKDVTINYAYYNFFERKLTRKRGRYFVNDRPLALCQFSGYIDGEPEKISKYYQCPRPDNAVVRFFKEYEEALVAMKAAISK